MRVIIELTTSGGSRARIVRNPIRKWGYIAWWYWRNPLYLHGIYDVEWTYPPEAYHADGGLFFNYGASFWTLRGALVYMHELVRTQEEIEHALTLERNGLL